MTKKVTVPLGEVGFAELSVIVAVHWLGWLKATDEGLQLALVDVAPSVTMAAKLTALVGNAAPVSPPMQYTKSDPTTQLKSKTFVG